MVTSVPIYSRGVFVDFYFYLGINAQPIVKEFAYASLLGEFGEHYIFTPPYANTELTSKDQVTASWCEHNLKTIPWNDGMVPYSQLTSVLQKMLDHMTASSNKPLSIFIKGREKAKVLKSMLANLTLYPPNIIEMEDSLQTPSLKKLKSDYPAIYTFTKCYFHGEGCVLANVHLLIRWYWEHLYQYSSYTYSDITVG
ncbi:MAG TPA: hypothetical protein VE076_05385 [Nitrososphaeraceae archaeon]|nr:hypothetical protein [Nitrososphaeraceae archaeon]